MNLDAIMNISWFASRSVSFRVAFNHVSVECVVRGATLRT